VTDYDYVIVGAGSAGCVLANRLSARPDVSVVLLETGPGDGHPYVSMPRGVARLVSMPSHMWFYSTRPEVHTSMKPDIWLRGKVLGGSSSVNGMVWVRGQPADFDDLAAVTSPDWNWQHFSQAYTAIENHELGAGPARGGDGPLRISLPTFRNPLTAAINAAGEKMGWPVKEDVNAPDDGQGVGYMPRTIWKGKRQSAAVAFLQPVRSRPNLTVTTGAMADRVLFDGTRAVGVEVLRGAQREQIGARRELLICAGTVASPGILERSGIGDAARLASLGVPLIHANAAVGENASEHRAIRMQWRLRRGYSLNSSFQGWRLPLSVLRYYLTGGGPMSGAAIDMRACFRSRPELKLPDIQTQFGMYSWNLHGQGGELEREPGFCAVANPIRSVSRGSIHIRSRNPAELPDIVANYGSEAQDRADVVAAARTLRRFASQEPLASLIQAETAPGPTAQSDEDILAALDRFGCAGMHTVGSCRMGNDAASVVDPGLRVRGVQQLRVVDASVMPFIPAGNTNAPTLALAWRAADIMLRER
jgi:choline dehydrogenase